MKSILTVLAGAAMLSQARAAVLSFEELPLGNPATDGSTQYGATGTYYWNGSNQSGGFASGGLSFQTNYTLPYGSWSGFGYSNTTDTATAGWTNQFSALSGGGAGGSSNYLIAYQDTYVGSVPTVSFSRRDLAGHGFMVTNTTYAGLSMRDGYFGSKKFGGTTGNDPDWFLMTITAYDTGLPGNSVSFYLADFRFANNALDYIVDDWTYVDLGSLGTADQLKITFSSSDNHPLYGMNTPAYAALDNFQVIPEAGGPVLAALGLAAALLRRRRCACLAVAVAGAGLAGLVPQPAMAGPYSSAYCDAENACDAPVPGFV